MKEEHNRDFNDYNEISCPHCGECQRIETESLGGIVSYWGEDEPDERDCNHCDKPYFIREIVSRSWEILKTADEEI